MTIKNANGYNLDFEAAVYLMDDQIREDLHNKLAPCTEQDYFKAYELAHAQKYGECWELSKSNPVW